MILTLTWKEVCEHRAIWVAMAFLTSVLGFGLARIVAPTDAALATAVATLTNLGLAAAYGVVCGSMMLAGEHEAGTLAFLDIFLGRREMLWLGKWLIGTLLAVTQALTVALALYLMQQAPPAWCVAVVGFGERGRGLHALAIRPRPELWFLLLPVVTLEAYAWGMFGSALTRRVLPAAAVSAMVATPIWLFAICAASPVVLAVRAVAAGVVLLLSHVIFVMQERDPSFGPARELEPEEVGDPKEQFIELWEKLERKVPPIPHLGQPVAPASSTEAEVLGGWDPQPVALPSAKARRGPAPVDATAPRQVLWWLTWQQAWLLCGGVAVASLLVGLLMPLNGQVLWPVATLVLGVACGTASFAAEQRDLSYQFLAAQHFPLPAIWRFKTLFWLVVAVLASLLLVVGGLWAIATQGALRGAGVGRLTFHFGTLRELLGPAVFFGAWLVYGFCAGQVFVWLCRKTILAILLAVLVSAGALGLWLPSLLCGGMRGWQVWVLPLLTLGAARLLVRAWAGGRIKERKPIAALVGYALVGLAWVGVNFGYRVCEIPQVGPPLDVEAFKASIPTAADNLAGQKLELALTTALDALEDEQAWLKRLAEATPLPVGMIEMPRSDGQAPNLRHLPAVPKMTERLRARAEKDQNAGRALDYLAQLLMLSRNLRNKAPVESYLVGIKTEASALDGLDRWLTARPTPELLRRALEELNRHAAETPAALDCLKTECFRAGGLLAIPTLYTQAHGRIPERWLGGGIALSLDTPWEDARKIRLWQVVWAGLFRAMETPPWQLPRTADEPLRASKVTQDILRGWLPGDALSPAEVARQLDASWLTDERLFAPVVPLRDAGTRARWRVDSTRLTTALALYRLAEGKPAARLDNLVPKYQSQLPTDPYSGETYRYRLSQGEQIDGLGKVAAGQGVVWSTGPDGVDHGGEKHGTLLTEDLRWEREGLDLIRLVPDR